MIKKAFIVISLFLAGCANQQQYNTTGSLIAVPEASSPYVERQDAVGSLLNSAWRGIASGNLSGADSALARAMRIKPTDPAIYFHMAEIRKKEGQIEQAKQLAGRAMSLGPDSKLKRKLQNLMSSLS